MSDLSLAAASIIVDKALERGRELGLAPLTVIVLDSGGHLKAAKREDNSSLLREKIATGKAWGALGMGFGGRELARRAAKAPQFYAAITPLAEGGMVAVPGGVIVRSSAGALLGSVGISGDTSDNDELCALHGIAAAGLVADTGDPPAK